MRKVLSKFKVSNLQYYLRIPIASCFTEAYKQYRHLKTHSSQTEAPPSNITPPGASPTPVDDNEVFGMSLNKPVAEQRSPQPSKLTLNKPVWKLRHWTKGKGYQTVIKVNETVANGNQDHVTSEGVDSKILESENKDTKDITITAVRVINLHLCLN